MPGSTDSARSSVTSGMRRTARDPSRAFLLISMVGSLYERKSAKLTGAIAIAMAGHRSEEIALAQAAASQLKKYIATQSEVQWRREERLLTLLQLNTTRSSLKSWTPSGPSSTVDYFTSRHYRKSRIWSPHPRPRTSTRTSSNPRGRLPNWKRNLVEWLSRVDTCSISARRPMEMTMSCETTVLSAWALRTISKASYLTAGTSSARSAPRSLLCATC